MSNFLDVPTSTGPSKLASMLGTSSSSSVNSFPNSSSSTVPSKKKIVCIDSDSSDDDDEDMPPSIIDEGLQLKELAADKQEPAVVEEEDTGPTLMERMMADAAIAKKAEDEKKAKIERKKAKKFGGGLKGGFFDKPKGKEKKDKKKVEEKKAEPEPEPVYELSPEGEMIPTITKKEPEKSSLVFDEVQQSMQQNILNPDAKKEWATDSLFEKISKNPRLQIGLQNPRFMQAIEDMKTNPEMAQKKYKGQKDIEDFITEFAGVMGSHFNEVGEKKEKEEKPQQQTQQPMGPSVGPLAEQALKREEERRKKGEVGWDESEANQNKVDEIVANEELSSILMDPEMQRVLQECGIPGRMNKYMQDPKWGPKIRKLIDNGLLKVEK
ncbi:hypothetical protein TrST_g6642 [Triparma strigata]|uniref:STI1 domain-containing protein n=2 Tax=Triparma strigata TaxID=1606541 RepID=A0A9W7ECL8_9STRA|nr:hypothetical protein TrST_g6642 [Triparma strigata]